MIMIVTILCYKGGKLIMRMFCYKGKKSMTSLIIIKIRFVYF